MKRTILDSISKYRFEFRHVTVLFLIMLTFQILLSFIQKESLKGFLQNTQKWYQQDSAEKIANLTTTSIELIVENTNLKGITSDYEKSRIIQSFNIIFSQQTLQKSVEEIYLIVEKGGEIFTLNDGRELFDYLASNDYRFGNSLEKDSVLLNYFKERATPIKKWERIYTKIVGRDVFHLFVPFVPNGEFKGVLYMKKRPDFANITNEIVANYEETAIIYSSLILMGLLAMYYISSYTLKERNEAQKRLNEEEQKHLREQIIREKEMLFTKRIYHTHHKAEKVMGFIKEDLNSIVGDERKDVIYRIKKYSNFISRVIYDMKWFDPPINTIRGMMFQTDLNEVIKFIIDNIFLRLATATKIYSFEHEYDPDLPKIHINEFVVWEILEPLIQNCIDHANVPNVVITVTTKYDPAAKIITILVRDNGKGISINLLQPDVTGIKKLFSESITTKNPVNQNAGYGCYIAYEIGVKRCGWELDASNLEDGGALFMIKIKV